MKTHPLKASYDLRQLVAQDLGPAAKRGGRAHLWRCPFHDERRGYSLAVWADGYRCFGRCALHGDALDWLQRYRRLSFSEALQVIGDGLLTLPATPRVLRAGQEPPDAAWQSAALAVVARGEDQLWSEAGAPALTYLLDRSLNIRTIRNARLGYLPGDYRAWQTVEGLRVPCGILLPWFASGALWAVKVRRAAGTPKYQQIAGGSSGGLYGADTLTDYEAALFCEGEFDTLIACQEAGRLIAPVTLGSATAPLSTRWYSALAHCKAVLVAYDADGAGRQGALQLLTLSARFHRLPLPFGKDVNEFHLDGGDVYRWIARALSALSFKDKL